MPTHKKSAARSSVLGKSASYARAIGLATGEMAILENLLGQMMAAALKLDPKVGQIIYLSSHTAFGRVATLDIAAASVLPATSLALGRVRTVAKRARELLQAHHQMAHDIWDVAGAPRGGSPAKIAAHTAKLLQQAASVRDLADEVRIIIRQVHRTA